MTNEVESTKVTLFLLRISVNLYLYAYNFCNSITNEKLASKF